ncbi:MAG: DJ-1/PfpI family protein [Actinobacteria bacterium]|nr:DJ-1/PfpI family protein [Actinomycetota bacterium]
MAAQRKGRVIFEVIVLCVAFLILFADIIVPGPGERSTLQEQEGETGIRGTACAYRASGTVLLVVPPRDFTDREYRKTRERLEEEGFCVQVASTSLAEARGQEGTVVMPDITIYQAVVDDYVAVAFIGGGGAGQLFYNAAAHDLAREANRSGKTVGAICMAPVILAKAGVLNGRNATAIPSVAGHLDDAGANYIYEDVVVDGNIVTGCAPHASRAFGERLVDNIAP